MKRYYILIACLGIATQSLTKPTQAQHLLRQCTAAQARIQKLMMPLQKHLKALSLPVLQKHLASTHNPWKKYAALYGKASKNKKAFQKHKALTKKHTFLHKLRTQSQKKVAQLQREQALAKARLQAQQVSLTLTKVQHTLALVQQSIQNAHLAQALSYKAQAQQLLTLAQTQQQHLAALLPQALKTHKVKARKHLAQQAKQYAHLVQQYTIALTNQQTLIDKVQQAQTQATQSIQAHTALLTQLTQALTATNQAAQQELHVLATTPDAQLRVQSHKIAALLKQAQTILQQIATTTHTLQTHKVDLNAAQAALAPLAALHATQQDQFNRHQEAHLQECPLCLNDVAPSKIQTLSCGHIYCSDCVQGQARACLDQNTPLVCKLHKAGALCNTPFTHEELVRVFDQATLQQVEQRAAQQALQRNPNYKHCPTPGCTYGYLRNDARPQTIACPTCKHSHCTQCLKEHPQTITCHAFAQRSVQNTNDKLFDQWKAAKHVRPCPQCKAPIEKNEGCRAMTCAKCKYKFCWRCMGPLHDYPRGTCRKPLYKD